MHGNKKNRRLNGLRVFETTTLLTTITKRLRSRTDNPDRLLIPPMMEETYVDTYSNIEMLRRRWAM